MYIMILTSPTVLSKHVGQNSGCLTVYCVITENIHTSPTEEIESCPPPFGCPIHLLLSETKFSLPIRTAQLNFLCGGVWIFSGMTH